ncbi:DUF4160 domain-containing protein [Thiocystis violascens]|nr:DUF4160 domain-containing protein [Thiocystis violascens]
MADRGDRDKMPTVMKIGRFRFHFYSDEGAEPPHIHVRCSDGECKFWLSPVTLARNRGIPPHDLREIERLIFEQRQSFVDQYHEYHQ